MNGAVDMKRVMPVLRAVGALEDEVLRRRATDEQRQKSREKQRNRDRENKLKQAKEREQEEEIKAKEQGLEVKAKPERTKDFNITFKKKMYESSQPEQGQDEVRLGEEGWRNRYYQVFLVSLLYPSCVFHEMT